MKYSVDKVENNIVLLENIENGIKKEVDVALLPLNISEGSIIIFENGRYLLDLDEERKRRERILNKFSRLKKK